MEQLFFYCELLRHYDNVTFDSDYEPWFEPPGWIIGPIWLVLYTMLAISFMMMLSKKEEISKSNLIIVLFIIQLIVNLMWPGVFNSAQYLTSFLMIIVMVIFTTIYAYVIFEPAKNASILVWPYIIWVSFAGIINFAYYLNAR
ncbi:MAG TPA: tryptophan-rich sensory protein [Candidatus Poseidoniales archaeon]|nr:MAG TPA: tryptophan-rich sensory protein [Candidatus Poseidoniales archaeon]DAC57716.1 MAG TPA: tryptophan-rich sensory protein [Candidatus Poseidoniales archaeon]